MVAEFINTTQQQQQSDLGTVVASDDVSAAAAVATLNIHHRTNTIIGVVDTNTNNATVMISAPLTPEQPQRRGILVDTDDEDNNAIQNHDGGNDDVDEEEDGALASGDNEDDEEDDSNSNSNRRRMNDNTNETMGTQSSMASGTTPQQTTSTTINTSVPVRSGATATATNSGITLSNSRGRSSSSNHPTSLSNNNSSTAAVTSTNHHTGTTTTTTAGTQGTTHHHHQQPSSSYVYPNNTTASTPINTLPSFLLSSPLSSTNTSSNNIRCINSANEINARLDTQVEVRVYPCNTTSTNGQQQPKKKFTSFTIKPEGVIIQGANRNNQPNHPRNNNTIDLGTEYATQIGRKLCRYELADTRACQLLVTTHANKSFWVVPAPEAFSRHSGTCRLLGDRKHPPAPHTMQVGDFLRVGSVGVVVIETHDGTINHILSEEKIQRIMKDTTTTNGNYNFLDLAETDGENSDDSMDGHEATQRSTGDGSANGAGTEINERPVCYMCFDEEDSAENPMITPCKCSGDTKFVHVECLRKWHTAEADNQICFLSSVDATCSVCKATFKSDFKLRDGRQVKLFKSSLEPPYVSLLVATKHEMAQRLFNTRFQLSFSTLMKPDGKNATRPLLLGRSSGSDMVLDYRTVSARHAAIRFKNGEFIFTDAGSSNGSYLYLRRPLELTPSQPVQFRLGRSMISMKVVNKWNRRLLRAVRGQRSNNNAAGVDDEDDGNMNADDRSIGSIDGGDVRINASDQSVQAIQRRTRESVMASLPPPGQLSQNSSKHLDLLFALAYPKRESPNKVKMDRASSSVSAAVAAISPTTSPAVASLTSPLSTVGVESTTPSLETPVELTSQQTSSI